MPSSTSSIRPVEALVYLDLDLYEPTRDTINAIRPYLTKGSVLASTNSPTPSGPEKPQPCATPSAPTTPPCAHCPAAPLRRTYDGAPSRSSGGCAYLDQQGLSVGQDELLQRGRLQVDRREIVSPKVNPV